MQPDPSQSNETSTKDGVSAIDVPPRSGFRTEDWWAIWLGWAMLLVCLAATWLARPDDVGARSERYEALRAQVAAAKEAGADRERVTALENERDEAFKGLAVNPLTSWFAKPGGWKNDPRDAFVDKQDRSLLPPIGVVFLTLLVLFGVGLVGLGAWKNSFPAAFLAIFVLAVFAFVLAGQEVVNHYNLEYALWALVVGLLISNTIGTPAWLRPALRTEFYIKTGLVLLGAEILFNRLLSLGVPGIFVSWVVTPIVLVSTYIFGQRVLRMESKSLNMVISADMSVCGVSAAIATAAACRAKREELSLAIGLSLSFTVIMMIVMPAVIKMLGISEVLGGAWIGGTVDSTGAVAAAGEMLGDTARDVAMTVKMIQNILIGAIAFAVAVYWVTRVENDPTAPRPGIGEVWRRFPKFVLGFLAASLVFSYLSARGPGGEAIVGAVHGLTGKSLRTWLFCLAFVSIGLETNFRELSRFLVGGKPLVLYVCGQALNLILTLAMAWLMFEKVFPDAATALQQ